MEMGGGSSPIPLITTRPPPHLDPPIASYVPQEPLGPMPVGTAPSPPNPNPYPPLPSPPTTFTPYKQEGAIYWGKSH